MITNKKTGNIFYDESLSRDSKGIVWKKSIGKEVKVLYHGEEYILLIKNYIPKLQSVVVEYNNEETTMRTSHFTKCNIGKIVKTYNDFKLSECGTYWIGKDNNGNKFLFDNDEMAEKIMEYNWGVSKYNTVAAWIDYERVVMSKYILNYIDNNCVTIHLNRDPSDNRKCNLKIVDKNESFKNLEARASTGIVGLRDCGSGGYIGRVCINNIICNTKTKIKEEALIDLLIVQRENNYMHNIDMYHLLDNVCEERVNEVLENINRQLNKSRDCKITKRNKFELSECKSYYWMIDANNNKCKIDIEDKKILESGLWNLEKAGYFRGKVIIDNVKLKFSLHRYIMGIHIGYNDWLVDHINNDTNDNRKCNLRITNHKGNSNNKKIKGYSKENDVWRVKLKIKDKYVRETYKTEDEAKSRVEELKVIRDSQCLYFKNKEELEYYLNKNNLKIS